MNALRKSLPILVLLALALSACSSIGAFSPASESRMISVSGIGKTSVAPDMVIVNLAVQTQDPDVARAVAENNRRSDQVKEAVTELGVAAEDLQTTFFNVWVQQMHDEFGNPTGETVFWVENGISLKLRNLDILGELLQAALSEGATSVNGVTYTVEDPSGLLDTARLEAIEKARTRAEQMATAAGTSLGDVLTISDSQPMSPFVFETSIAADGIGGGGGVPTSPGTLEFQVQVFVTYALR